RPGDSADQCREFVDLAERDFAVGRGRHSQFATHVRHHRRIENSLRHRVLRFAANSWRQRRVSHRQRSRPNRHCRSTSAFSAGNAYARKTGDSRCRWDRFGCRAQQCRFETRPELLLLHQLLRLLSAAGHERKASSQQPPKIARPQQRRGKRPLRFRRILMQHSAAILLFVFAFATGAFAQATLRIGDPVELKVGGVPAEDQNQVNNTYTVDAGGAVNLPYIGKVHAEGKTPAELSRAIEENYRSNKIYSNPNI